MEQLQRTVQQTMQDMLEKQQAALSQNVHQVRHGWVNTT